MHRFPSLLRFVARAYQRLGTVLDRPRRVNDPLDVTPLCADMLTGDKSRAESSHREAPWCLRQRVDEIIGAFAPLLVVPPGYIAPLFDFDLVPGWP